jgi:hypothetical protein
MSTKLKIAEQIGGILAALFIAFVVANGQVHLVDGPTYHKVTDLVIQMLALLGFTVAGPGAARAVLAKAFGFGPPALAQQAASSAPPPTPPKAA